MATAVHVAAACKPELQPLSYGIQCKLWDSLQSSGAFPPAIAGFHAIKWQLQLPCRVDSCWGPYGSIYGVPSRPFDTSPTGAPVVEQWVKTLKILAGVGLTVLSLPYTL